MRLLDSLERRFGRYAIRGILGYILLFQCVVFTVLSVNGEFASQLDLISWKEMAAEGSWWRLLSFMILPGSTSILMFIFYVSIMLMFMNRIESGFGAFRMNLFVGLFILTQWLAAAFPAFVIPMRGIFYNNLLFVFAVMEPNMSILLFGIVPLTARTIALVAAGLLLLSVIQSPAHLPSVILALVPFLCFGIPIFVRNLRHRSQVGSRRSRFKANSLATTDSFHTCSVCGRTDASNPDLDFRITGDGVEYCVDHLPKGSGSGAQRD